jgi:hypothetical protein
MVPIVPKIGTGPGFHLSQVTVKASIALLALICLGCSDILVPVPSIVLYPCTLPSTLPVDSLALTGTTYHAYGDSITYGFLLPTTKDAYPYLVAADRGLTLIDNGVNGAQACDISPAQIFPHSDNPTAASNMLYTVMIGTNDAARDVPGYTAIFDQCHQAAISWLAVPAESKVGAVAAGVTTKGGGRLDTSNNWNSWVTSRQGASISFPISVATDRPLYIWARIIDADPGTFTYDVDGTVVGTSTTGTTPVIKTSQSTMNSLALLRIPPVSAGAHVVTLTQTSTAGTMQIVAIGAPPDAGAGLPNVLVGDIPYAVKTASTGCAGTDTPSLKYIAEIQKTVVMLSGDGLNVRYIPTRAFMFGTVAEMVDQVHPNERGHVELSKAYEAALR